MLDIQVTPAWRDAFPGAHIGLLEVSRVDNTPRPSALDAEKEAVAERLRRQYAGYTRADFLALPVMAAYWNYYKRFGKTYHVLLQVESVALRGKPLPSVSPLVDANFAAELDTLTLAAGHDVARLAPPVVIDVTRDDETFSQMGGARKALRAGDMVMRDADGIACTILYGQDDRSPISAATTHALYVVYAPIGVGAAAVQAQVGAIERNIALFAPDHRREQARIASAPA
ncbi:MAG: hypothetical protein KIS91_05275 [Anaerolineae bacterium]|nr:hypothetical protein [Anaerolineae bacterium]